MIFCLALLFLIGCNLDSSRMEVLPPEELVTPVEDSSVFDPLFIHVVAEDIPVKRYFPWITSLAMHYDSLVPYSVSPQLLAHANPWVIDSFAHSDYYFLMARDTFVYDQQSWTIIKAGDTLLIPSQLTAEKIEAQLQAIHIDINLPEYTLRIMQEDSVLFSVPVRIGQHRSKYLATEGRTVDLHTVRGTGEIVDIIYEPRYINFKTGAQYVHTRRDDGKTTLMPLIPTLEPEINGVCYGQLIHPTTNPNTLGKAYSHGCIGTREGDAWRIFFHIRIGTPIEIRYDLTGIDSNGDTLLFPDVYRLNQ